MIKKKYYANKKIIWIDLLKPSADEIKKIEKEYHLKIPLYDAFREIRHLQVTDNQFTLLLPNMTAIETKEKPAPIGFIVNPKLLITIHFLELPSFELAKNQLASTEVRSGYKIFTTIIEQIVYLGGEKLEELNICTGNISRDIFYSSIKPHHNIAQLNKKFRTALFNLGVYGEKTSQIREVQLGLQRIIPFVITEGSNFITNDLKTELDILKRDLDAFINFEMHLTNRIQFLLDAVLGFINTEQNDIFKVLTIVSVVGIPPTFIASWYGMNFHFLPEYLWLHGYLYVILLTIISIVLPIIWFIRRGWW